MTDPENPSDESAQPERHDRAPGAVAGSTASRDAARLATIWTTAYAGVVMVSAVVFLASVLGLVQLSIDMALVVYTVLGITAVVSWAALTSWMMRIRTMRQSLARPAPDAWKVWASWLIPVYAWFGPFQAMRDLTDDVEGIAPIRARWWASWLVAGLLWLQAFLLGSFALAVIGLTGTTISMFFSARALRQVITQTTESVARGS